MLLVAKQMLSYLYCGKLNLCMKLVHMHIIHNKTINIIMGLATSIIECSFHVAQCIKLLSKIQALCSMAALLDTHTSVYTEYRIEGNIGRLQL